MVSTTDIKQLSKINRGTPEVTVYSNQGLAVRQLRYCRVKAEDTAAEVRISLQRYDSSGQLKSSIDPRLSASYLKASSSIVPNQQQINTLSGVLQSKNVDAGTRVVVSDCRGQPLWSWDSRETQRSFEYDELRRLKQAYEKEKAGDWRCSDYLVYGKASDAERNNTVGRLLEHDDTAGQRKILKYSVLAQVQQESRRYLKSGEEVDWSHDQEANTRALEELAYQSRWSSNALGEPLLQEDAFGNEQRTAYEVSGQVRQVSLRLKGQTKERILSQEREYAANGQLAEEKLSASAVQVQYTYEEKTQRLQCKKATRLSDSTVLQSLQYHYDPVGNIIAIDDQTQAIDHYKNAKAEPVKRYTYDSLYQLISAEGVESEQAGTQSKTIVFGNKDASRLVNYQRNYSYDAGGNLEQIAQGANPVVKLCLDTTSNRGIEKRDSGPSLQESFDGNGNLLYLNVGQPLAWDNRNQLEEAVQVKREEGISDQESYVYDSQGNRIQKTRVYLAENQIHTQRVRYLPGVELREHWQSDLQGENKTVTEQLCFIQVQSGETIKALHWEIGRPNEIENDALYYSLNDQIGSHQVEINEAGEVVNYESYYPYGGTAIWATKNQIESSYKYYHYSGKEKDATGLYYYGYRYYLPCLGRWLNADPSGIADGLNLFRMAHNNPITFYDTDGRKPTPTFKQLYSKTEVDPITGGIYRPINEIYNRGSDLSRAENTINVRVWEFGKPGKGGYLFTGLEKAKRLVIEAHGGFSEKTPEGIIPLEVGMPTVTVLSPHARVLDSGLGHASTATYSKISHEGITLSSEQAKQHFKQSGYAKITGTTTKAAIHNYTLSKFETEPNRDYMSHYFENIAEAVSFSREEGQESFDVITIRKYRGASKKYRMAMLTARDVLDFARQQGYQEVIFNFCRSLCRGDREKEFIPKEFIAEDTIRLEKPEFKPWGTIGKSPAALTKLFKHFSK